MEKCLFKENTSTNILPVFLLTLNRYLPTRTVLNKPPTGNFHYIGWVSTLLSRLLGSDLTRKEIPEWWNLISFSLNNGKQIKY